MRKKKRTQLKNLVDRDPITKLPFVNVMQLRSSKIRNMWMLKDRVKNSYYINYEIARDHPREILCEISNFFGIELEDTFTPEVSYKGWGTSVFEPKSYPPISESDLLFINGQLDWALEESIGYEKKDSFDISA